MNRKESSSSSATCHVASMSFPLSSASLAAQPSDEQLDRNFRQQMEVIRDLTKGHTRASDLELCAKWLKVFSNTSKEEKYARNCLIALLHCQLKEKGRLEGPFTELANCNRDLRTVLSDYDQVVQRLRRLAVSESRPSIKRTMDVATLTSPVRPAAVDMTVTKKITRELFPPELLVPQPSLVTLAVQKPALEFKEVLMIADELDKMEEKYKREERVLREKSNARAEASRLKSRERECEGEEEHKVERVATLEREPTKKRQQKEGTELKEQKSIAKRYEPVAGLFREENYRERWRQPREMATSVLREELGPLRARDRDNASPPRAVRDQIEREKKVRRIREREEKMRLTRMEREKEKERKNRKRLKAMQLEKERLEREKQQREEERQERAQKVRAQREHEKWRVEKKILEQKQREKEQRERYERYKIEWEQKQHERRESEKRCRYLRAQELSSKQLNIDGDGEEITDYDNEDRIVQRNELGENERLERELCDQYEKDQGELRKEVTYERKLNIEDADDRPIITVNEQFKREKQKKAERQRRRKEEIDNLEKRLRLQYAREKRIYEEYQQLKKEAALLEIQEKERLARQEQNQQVEQERPAPSKTNLNQMQEVEEHLSVAHQEYGEPKRCEEQEQQQREWVNAFKTSHSCPNVWNELPANAEFLELRQMEHENDSENHNENEQRKLRDFNAAIEQQRLERKSWLATAEVQRQRREQAQWQREDSARKKLKSIGLEKDQLELEIQEKCKMLDKLKGQAKSQAEKSKEDPDYAKFMMEQEQHYKKSEALAKVSKAKSKQILEKSTVNPPNYAAIYEQERMTTAQKLKDIGCTNDIGKIALKSRSSRILKDISVEEEANVPEYINFSKRLRARSQMIHGVLERSIKAPEKAAPSNALQKTEEPLEYVNFSKRIEKAEGQNMAEVKAKEQLWQQAHNDWQNADRTKERLLKDLNALLTESNNLVYDENKPADKVQKCQPNERAKAGGNEVKTEMKAEYANKQEFLNKPEPKTKWDVMWSPLFKRYVNFEVPQVINQNNAPELVEPNRELRDDKPPHSSKDELQQQLFKQIIQDNALRKIRESSSQEYFKNVPRVSRERQQKRWSRFMEPRPSTTEESSAECKSQLKVKSSNSDVERAHSASSHESSASQDLPKYSLVGTYCPDRKTYVMQEQTQPAIGARVSQSADWRPAGSGQSLLYANLEQQQQYRVHVRQRVSEWERNLNLSHLSSFEGPAEAQSQEKEKQLTEKMLPKHFVSYCISTGRKRLQRRLRPNVYPLQLQLERALRHELQPQDERRLFKQILMGQQQKAAGSDLEDVRRQLTAENAFLARKLREAHCQSSDDQTKSDVDPRNDNGEWTDISDQKDERFIAAKYADDEEDDGGGIAGAGQSRVLDCQVSDWGAWSDCDKSCGTGMMTRNRQTLQAAQNGGKHCPSLVQKRGCQGYRCHGHRDKKILREMALLLPAALSHNRHANDSSDIRRNLRTRYRDSFKHNRDHEFCVEFEVIKASKACHKLPPYNLMLEGDRITVRCDLEALIQDSAPAAAKVSSTTTTTTTTHRAVLTKQYLPDETDADDEDAAAESNEDEAEADHGNGEEEDEEEDEAQNMLDTDSNESYELKRQKQRAAASSASHRQRSQMAKRSAVSIAPPPPSQTQSQSQLLSYHCRGEGLAGRTTRWSALPAPSCRGKWLRLTVGPPKKCNHAQFIFV